MKIVVTKHSEGTTVPAKVIVSIPAVPKYTEYLTFFLAVRILLHGIQLLSNTDKVIMTIANTVQFLCVQMTGHLTETDQGCGAISSVTTLTENPPDIFFFMTRPW